MLTCMKTITVANLKGGSAKTTTAAFLTTAFLNTGFGVLAIDSDPQASLLDWSQSQSWPSVAGLPMKNMHRRIKGIVPPGTDIVIIDTPPLEEKGGIVYGTLRAADLVVIPMAPTPMEHERLNSVMEAIAEVDDGDEPIQVAVLLNRITPRAASTGTFRDLIAESGVTVLNTMVPRGELYAQAFKDPIIDVGAYDDAAKEIWGLLNHG